MAVENKTQYKKCRKYEKMQKNLDTGGIFVIIIPMFFNVKEVDIYEDDIPT